MIHLRSLARSTSWLLPVGAAACFLLQSGAFGAGLLGEPLWNGVHWIDAPLLTYLLASGIVAAGLLPATPRAITGRDRRWAQALHGFWHNAIAVNAAGHGPITYAWYRTFLQFMDAHQWYGWFAKLIVGGEVVVGLALLLGGLVGVAAVGGALLNLNYGLAGAASANPILLLLGLLLAVNWRAAGAWGLDSWLLPRISTLANRDAVAAVPTRSPEPSAGSRARPALQALGWRTPS